MAIPDLTTQGAGKSWLSAIGSRGHDWARDISESVPPCCRRSAYAGSPPGVDDRGLAAGGPVVVRGAASAASPNVKRYGPRRSAPAGENGRRRKTSGPMGREGFGVGEVRAMPHPPLSYVRAPAEPAMQGPAEQVRGKRD